MRIARRCLVLGICLATGMMLAAQSNQALRADDTLPRVRPDVVYGHKDGMALTMDVIEPTQNRKGIALMFMVSGGWVSTWMPVETMAGLFQPLSDEGYTVIAVRHGSSPKYVIPEIVEDVRKALTHVHEHASEWQIDPKKLGVFGFSAGGHLSLMLGNSSGRRCLPTHGFGTLQNTGESPSGAIPGLEI